MRRLLKNQGGFTLIELLIVVLIIGVLAGIAVPKVAGYSDAAKKRACQANMKQIATALEAYYLDNNGKYPDTDSLDSVLSTYLKTVPKCPVDNSNYKYTTNNGKDFTLTCENHPFEVTNTSENWNKKQ
ncbi:MAG: ral secretion pathway protein [Bacillota bacterium]|jgi:type II secretion system protein G|nr:ral secretion pathway protein [Bacillota bacterium]